MTVRLPKKRWLVVILVIAGIVVAAGAAYFLTAGKASAPSGTPSPEERFKQLRQSCIDTYQRGVRSGNRYLRYPCTGQDIKNEYKKRYGEEYTGSVE